MSLFNNVHEEFSKDKLVKHWEKNILAKDGEKAMAGKLFDEIKKGKELDAVFNSVSIIVELCILDDILRGNEVKYSIDFGDKVKNEQGYFVTAGARDRIMEQRKEELLHSKLPNVFSDMSILGITIEDILSAYKEWSDDQAE